MEGIDLSFPSYAQHERMAAALEAIALNGGQNSAEALDAACRQLLDGTNTTRVFWSWYPRALAAGETDKYKLLSRFATDHPHSEIVTMHMHSPHFIYTRYKMLYGIK